MQKNWCLSVCLHVCSKCFRCWGNLKRRKSHRKTIGLSENWKIIFLFLWIDRRPDKINTIEVKELPYLPLWYIMTCLRYFFYYFLCALMLCRPTLSEIKHGGGVIAGVGIKCKDIFAIFKKSNFAILKLFFSQLFCIFPHFPSWYLMCKFKMCLKTSWSAYFMQHTSMITVFM